RFQSRRRAGERAFLARASTADPRHEWARAGRLLSSVAAGRSALVRLRHLGTCACARMARAGERQRGTGKAFELDRASLRRAKIRARAETCVMRVALATPRWSFDHSIYFGCREPHLPLEYGSARVLLDRAGHTVEIFDGHMFVLGHAELAAEIGRFNPDITVITTAPSYLFWRCAPPELRVPQELNEALSQIGGMKVVVGP